MTKEEKKAKLVEIGKRLREAREREGLTRHEVGEMLGVRYRQIERLENGQRDMKISTLLEIEKVVNAHILTIDYTKH